MQVTLDIPDTLAPNLTASGSDLARSLLQPAALKAFESGSLDAQETMQLLHLDSPEQLGALSDSF